MLSTFSVIVATDTAFGIGKNNDLPGWNSKDDARWFREKTIGRGNNAVIMGKTTYLSLPEQFRPLPNRHNIVISTTLEKHEHTNVAIFNTLLDALINLGTYPGKFEEVFVIGGEQLYTACLEFMYLCRRVYMTKFKLVYDCDRFFPFEAIQKLMDKGDVTVESEFKTRDFTRTTYAVNVVHPEQSYLNLLREVRDKGDRRPDRTGVGTKSLFGKQLTFDISERLPLFTTKQVSFHNILTELLWIVGGKTNSKFLEEKGNPIWRANTSKKFLEEQKLPYLEGDAGPIYGFQLRHWGAEYVNCNKDYTGQGIDQLDRAVKILRQDPFSRRIICSAWNVSDLDKMCLNPCHVMFQFYVDSTRTHLDCMVTMRGSDLCIGLPYNVCSYAILTYMVAHVTQLKPRNLVFSIGDAHLYSNHLDNLAKQIQRCPRPFPTLRIVNSSQIFELSDFQESNFELDGYTCWPHIRYDFCT